MLERLMIENVALIEKLDLELGPGFTVLTGETGAGKSIIIDGIDLALGGRGSRELISYGSSKCRVEAVFGIADKPEIKAKLEELNIENDGNELFITRELNLNGKSLCRVNGVMLPLASLKQMTDLLVDVHGQHEHQSLLDDRNHLSVIDAYGAARITPKKANVSDIFQKYSRVQARLNSGFLSEAERERRIDILNYQINEIESAKLAPDEEQRIKEELDILTNAEKISGSLGSAADSLSGEAGAVSMLKAAADAFAGISGFSREYADIHSRLSDLYYELEDAAYSVRDMRLDADFDPNRIDALETRLDAIDSLKHKYGRTVSEVLEFAANAKRELNELTGDAALREKLEAEKGRLLMEYSKAADELTKARKAEAEKLCSLAQEQLRALGIKKARLEAEFSRPDDLPHEDGSDSVSLLLSANEGEPLKPLSKVASGGELSRIMLALKTVITDADGIPTLIFDEVDTGISGATANTVGLRMKHIAGSHQVLCVTHLPQIAAFADSHYVVSKSERGGKTVTSVKKLGDDERPKELARIMGDESSSSAAVSHAAELIKKAREAELR
ncbi:MAG: DNA repair protein RecN [Clostridia bacterium]|nr:DNA repair protein RecN [Clostridia bacterium]